MLLLCFVSSAIAELKTPELVDIQAIVPSIRLDMRYATANNITRQTLYSQPRCLLRPRVASRLARVQAALQAQGLGLKVYDCYRPLSIQKRLWQIKPDPRYVADPKRGSRHNRGTAIDLTLVDRHGEALTMPSQFDDFSERSHLNYQGGSREARQHRELLQHAMTKQGFQPLATEWWHFDDPDWQKYRLLDIPLEQVK